MSYNTQGYEDYGSQNDVQVGTSGTYTIVNGMNFGAPSASGVTVAFTIASGASLGMRYFTVAAAGGNANGTVTVSGISNTINGASSAVTISDKTSKQFYNLSGTNWVSF